MWHREGVSRRTIAARLGKNPGSIHDVVRAAGGIAPRLRVRSVHQLSLADREAIERALARGATIRGIARWLGRAPSTISRDVHRRGGPILYCAVRADIAAWVARTATRTRQGRGLIVNAISISERPPEVDDRAVPGHWEGDLIVGRHGSYIATLVERTTRFVILVRVTSKETTVVIAALIRQIQRLPTHLMRSLMGDRGTELAHHRVFSVATGVQVYFCDPQSPWQRGSNENTNGLLRQYFPNGRDLSTFTQRQLDAVADRLNGRPRETLGFECPADVFARLLR